MKEVKHYRTTTAVKNLSNRVKILFRLLIVKFRQHQFPLILFQSNHRKQIGTQTRITYLKPSKQNQEAVKYLSLFRREIIQR